MTQSKSHIYWSVFSFYCSTFLNWIRWKMCTLRWISSHHSACIAILIISDHLINKHIIVIRTYPQYKKAEKMLCIFCFDFKWEWTIRGFFIYSHSMVVCRGVAWRGVAWCAMTLAIERAAIAIELHRCAQAYMVWNTFGHVTTRNLKHLSERFLAHALKTDSSVQWDNSVECIWAR